MATLSHSRRTDVHSPTNLVTEDYEFVGCGFYGSAGEPGFSPIGPNGPGAYLLDEGWHFGENHSAGDCYHCGARLKYYAVMKHLPSRTLVRIGETCLANRFERASAEFHQLRKQAALDRAAQRIKRERAVWFAIDEDRELAYQWADEQVEAGHYGYEGMRHRFVSQINRYGSVSDRFVRAMMRDMARTERREQERAERDRLEAETSSPVPQTKDRIEILGEVISVKWQENDYGGRLVMTVRDDRGFKVWGSVPESLARKIGAFSFYDADGMSQRREAAIGARVRFTARITRGDRDETFGFFKRPTNAELA